MTRLRTLIFDLGGVLVDVDSRTIFTRLAHDTGWSLADIERALLDPVLLHPLELGQVTPEQYFQEVSARLPLRWTYEQFVDAWNGILSENQAATVLLERLRARYTIGVITNTNVLHDRYIRETWPIFTRTHHWVASCQVGLRKPDPAIFRLALRQANAEPASTVYVDDVEEHVQSARRLGMSAIRCIAQTRLADELRALGVEW